MAQPPAGASGRGLTGSLLNVPFFPPRAWAVWHGTNVLKSFFDRQRRITRLERECFHLLQKREIIKTTKRLVVIGTCV